MGNCRFGIAVAGQSDFFGPIVVVAVMYEAALLDDIGDIRPANKHRDDECVRLANMLCAEGQHKTVTIGPSKLNQLYCKTRNIDLIVNWAKVKAFEKLTETNISPTDSIDPRASMVAGVLARAAFIRGLQKLENVAGNRLSKGANSNVIDTGKRIVLDKGRDVLKDVSKVHFKCYQTILLGLLAEQKGAKKGGTL